MTAPIEPEPFVVAPASPPGEVTPVPPVVKPEKALKPKKEKKSNRPAWVDELLEAIKGAKKNK